MRHATWRSLLAHKVRLALTAVSVVLGVAFIAGTLVLTDTLNHTFDTLFGDADRGTAVAVRGRAAFTADTNGGADERASVPAALLAPLAHVEGAKDAVGLVEGYAQLVDKAGKAIKNGGAPGLGRSWTTSRELSPLGLQSGRGPVAGDEIAIDSTTAREHGLRVGDTLTVLLKGPPRPERVVGVFRFGSSGNLAGATLTSFDQQTAQQVLGQPGTFSSIKIAAQPGVSQRVLASRVGAALPAGYEAITGTQLAAENSQNVKKNLAFVSSFLLVFAVISLFVGAFIIFNTFSMLVAQRTRELALFRAIGASRRQVTRSVLAESVAVGIFGSTLGLGSGVLMAFGLRALFNALGFALPAGPLAFEPHTVVWAYVVGVGVTAVASLAPARRAAKIPPVAALRDDARLPARSLRRRAVIGSLFLLGGAALMTAGLSGAGGRPAPLVGFGAAAVFIGVSTLSPFISNRVIRVIGAPLPAMFGLVGRLGQHNALRNPRRTSTTAAALMIGLALVSAMSVMGASLTKSFTKIVDNSLGADYVVTSSTFAPFSADLAARIQREPGVAAVTSFRSGQARFGGFAGPSQLQGVQPETVGRTLNLITVGGSIDSLAGGALLVEDQKAIDNHWRIGQQVPVEYARTGRSSITLGGTYRQNPLAGSYLVSTRTYEANFSNQLDQVVAIRAATGANQAALRTSLGRVVAGFPGVTMRDQTEYKAFQQKQINQLLTLVLVLLLLAVVIAALGIVNTLALSVVERTREIGMLRAVGMSRRQLRRTIRLESMVIALFGGLLGLAVGVVFGWALVRALNSAGIDQLSVPAGRLGVYLVAAGLVGVTAAWWPARRAARMDVLRAIATQ